MIKVTVLRDECNYITSICAEGHSGYEDIGKDIVCASVSTAMIMTSNLLEKLDVKFDLEVNENKALMSIKIHHDFVQNKTVQTILMNLVSTLDDVSKEYKQNLKITKN